MSYQNRWRDAFITMFLVVLAAYFFDLRDLWRQHEHLENTFKHAEIQASIRPPDKVAASKVEVPPPLALLTHLLREYHLQITTILSPDNENYRIKVSGSYAALRQFITALRAAAEFSINDMVIVSESETNAHADLNMQFSTIGTVANGIEKSGNIQYATPFCFASSMQKEKLFKRDDGSVLGTVRRGNEIHSIVLYPDGVITEMNN